MKHIVYQIYRGVFVFLGILFCFPVWAQQLAPPLPQPPFEWKDFNPQKHQTSLKVNGKLLDSATVKPFLAKPGKGTVRQSFQNAVLSGQSRTYPFDYQYAVRFSPDKRYYLIYRYDYSRPELWVYGKILNADFSTKQSFSLRIDDGTVSHGYCIDNEAAIYGIYTDTEDAVYVMHYQPTTQNSDWLEVGADVTRRNRFVPVLGATGILFLANLSEDENGHWKGVMFTTFDFAHQEIKDLYWFAAEELQEKLGKKMPMGRYEIIEFAATAQQMTVVLQKVAIQANRYVYDPFTANQPLLWIPRKQQIQYGEKITITINADHKVIQRKVEDVFVTKEL